MPVAERANPPELRRALTDALIASGGLPVSPLVEIVLEYTRLIPLTVSTLKFASGRPLTWPLSCVLWHPDERPIAADGPLVLFTNFKSNEILALNPRTNESWQFAGGVGSYFAAPAGIAVDPFDNSILVTENSGHRVSRLTSNGTGHAVAVTSVVIAGAGRSQISQDGVGTEATFCMLSGIACSSVAARFAIVSERGVNRMRRIDLRTNRVSTVAMEKGPHAPQGVVFEQNPAVAAVDTVVYVASSLELNRIDLTTGVMTKVFGLLTNVRGLLWLPPHLLLITTGRCVYLVDTATQRLVTRVAGVSSGARGCVDGAIEHATFHSAGGMVLLPANGDGDGERLLLCDSGNDKLRYFTGSIMASFRSSLDTFSIAPEASFF